MKKTFLLYGMVACWIFSSCIDKYPDKRVQDAADSLNSISYEMRYKDLSISLDAATQAYKLLQSSSALRAEALNNMAFCAFMKMDFENADSLYRQALKDSRNEIERLIADVGLMKICQRVSMNKEFYDYRSDALARMQRIDEENTQSLSLHEKKRLSYAYSEFYIVSAIYFYYLQQQEASLQAIDNVDKRWLENDTAQTLYYEYMRGSGGMYRADSREQLVVGEFSYLVNCLLVSKAKGYVYFEANALQAMAELLNFRSNRDILKTKARGALRLVNVEDIPVDSLPLHYARQALSLFKQYDDWYQISGTYRTIATYYNHVNEPEKALENLKHALGYVNLHHEKYYHCTDSADRLQTYVPFYNGIPVELKWIKEEKIKTIPEWILRLREQLSRTYSAMGRKPESDYNRNIYLDLLDYTRQDKELESRYGILRAESRQLNFLLLLVAVGLTVLVVLFVVFTRRWRKRNKIYIASLKRVFRLCREITSAIPAHTDTDKIVSVILRIIKRDFTHMFGVGNMKIVLSQNDDSMEAKEYIADDTVAYPLDSCFRRYELIVPGADERIGWLELCSDKPIKKEKETLLRLVLPYLSWTLNNGLNLVSLDDERKRLAKEQFIHEQHLAEKKRQNMVKKACLAIVTGILPYVDRVVNEVQKLKLDTYWNDRKIRKEKYVYIDELVTRINEYNDILAMWIKVRQGALSLNIENFELNELFAILVKGRKSFEMKGQQFVVHPTNAIVKADKALTLFMMNTLTENARKYTQEGGEIILSAEEYEQYVEISVTDNGPGLSEEDVRYILNDKVYDSGKIGMNTATDKDELQKQKGHGFGLMNCRGIIDKYRKTNVLFNVCQFGIDSIVGKGSRFYFRLPKGTKRLFSIVGGIFLLFGGVGCTSVVDEEQIQTVDSVASDSLLMIANDYANLVYECNVNGAYQEALVYADSVLSYMNKYYLCYSGKQSPLLSLYDADSRVNEQVWLSEGFDTDYYILLDVRNEVAIAGLAVNNFFLYYYNNLVYTLLYKQISKDYSLEQYCVQMQHSSNNKIIALFLLFLLVLICIVGYYMLYLRHRLHYRYNMEQVFTINKAVFASLHPAEKDFAMNLMKRLFVEMNELVAISDMALALYSEDIRQVRYVFYNGKEDEELPILMQRCMEKGEAIWMGMNQWTCFPLCLDANDGALRIGGMAIKMSQSRCREDDRLLIELVSDYVAIAIYNAVIRVKQKHTNLELMQDEAHRTIYEENMLHVQNQVLDNCLSSIKHETVYYPNRIKQIIVGLRKNSNCSDTEENEQLQTIDELITYYKGIITILSSCAARQLAEITFRRIDVEAHEIVMHAQKYLEKQIRKFSYRLTLEIEMEQNIVVRGDKVLLFFLVENLIDEAVRYLCEGTLRLRITADQDFACFVFTDFRRNYTQVQLNNLFYPSLSRMQVVKGGELTGVEYLICKQIIREHDEFGSKRGCRINANPTVNGGYDVWFTVPVKQVKTNNR